MEEPIAPVGTDQGYFIPLRGGGSFEHLGDLIGDLDALCDEGLMGFRYSERGNKLYNIKQAGYDAVDNDFEVSLIPESPALAQPMKGLSVEEWGAHLQDLLKTHEGNLHYLESQAASFGLNRPLYLLNQIEYERAEIERLKQDLSALEETQPSEDYEIQADLGGSAVAGGGGGLAVTGDVLGNVLVLQPDWSQPMSEVLGELNRVREAIADLTSKFHQATAQRAVAASILGDVEVQQEEDLCFVLMPFGDDMLQEVYEVHIKPTVERVGLQCKRADDVLGPTPIMEDIWKGIHSARVVLAELTGQNPNVFYELGLCHAIGKDAILLAQDIKWVPFDVRHRRTIIYTPTPRGCKQLEEVLGKTLETMLGKAPAE
jgi:hypothetical protein